MQEGVALITFTVALILYVATAALFGMHLFLRWDSSSRFDKCCDVALVVAVVGNFSATVGVSISGLYRPIAPWDLFLYGVLVMRGGETVFGQRIRRWMTHRKKKD